MYSGLNIVDIETVLCKWYRTDINTMVHKKNVKYKQSTHLHLIECLMVKFLNVFILLY